MTAAELIAGLQQLDPEVLVMARTTDGSLWRCSGLETFPLDFPSDPDGRSAVEIVAY